MENQNFEKKTEEVKITETDVKVLLTCVAVGAGLYLIGRKTGFSNGFIKGYVAGKYGKQ